MTSDLVNGLFELVGAAALLVNVRALVRDKEVRGVSPWTTAFFTSWGLWNLYFYPAVGLWASFLGGACLVLANAAWLALVFYYARLRPAWMLLRDVT